MIIRMSPSYVATTSYFIASLPTESEVPLLLYCQAVACRGPLFLKLN